jgi:DNA-binding NarL/FixJ family response regulator
MMAVPSGSKDVEGRRSPRALLADDHTMFRESLAGILASRGGVEVVGQVPNGDGLIPLVRREKPDLVFTEIGTPVRKAKEGLRELLSVSPPPKVVVVSAREDPRLARDLDGLGVSAYIPKTAPVEHLLAAVRAVLSGPECATVASLGVYGGTDGEPPERGPSERELEVLVLAARGLSNRLIARELHLADGTVKRHLANVYQKMGVRSRNEAVRKALMEQWVGIDEIVSAPDEGDRDGSG